MSQSYASHSHHPVPTYVATVFLLLSLGLLVSGWTGSHLDLAVAMLWAAAFVQSAIGRTYTVKLQDRIILLEMQVRCARVLPAAEAALLARLSTRQVVALRFASDRELGTLLRRAADEGLDPDAIKKAVTEWQPDLLRT